MYLTHAHTWPSTMPAVSRQTSIWTWQRSINLAWQAGIPWQGLSQGLQAALSSNLRGRRSCLQMLLLLISRTKHEGTNTQSSQADARENVHTPMVPNQNKPYRHTQTQACKNASIDSRKCLRSELLCTPHVTAPVLVRRNAQRGINWSLPVDPCCAVALALG